MSNSEFERAEQSGDSGATGPYGLAEGRVRRIAVFGPRGSGKTCFFASLYGHNAEGDVAVSIVDEGTLLYMEAQWNAYVQEGGFPGATANEIPQHLKFDLAEASTDRNWPVEVLDHAGALIERSTNTEDDLRQLVRGWLRECEAILIFLDTGSKSGGAIERRNEVAQLLGILREESESAKIAKPLGLLFTKWDEHQPLPADAEDAQQQVSKYLELHPGFNQIRATLVAFGVNLNEFPISALGWDRIPGSYPTAPYNLLTPLVWAMEQADRQRFLAAERRAATASSSNSIRIWNSLIQADGIASGPVFAEISLKLDESRHRYRRQILTRLASVACTFVLITLAGWVSWVRTANHAYAEWKAYCESDHGKIDEGAETRAAMAEKLIAQHRSVWSKGQIDELEYSVLVDKQIAIDVKETREFLPIEKAFKQLSSVPSSEEKLAGLDRVTTRLNEFAKNFVGGKQSRRRHELVNEVQSQKFVCQGEIRDKKERGVYEAIEVELARLKESEDSKESKLSDDEKLVRLVRLENSLQEFKKLFGGQKYGQDHLAAFEDIHNQKLVVETIIRNRNEKKAFEAIESEIARLKTMVGSDEERVAHCKIIVGRLEEFGKSFGGRVSGQNYVALLDNVRSETVTLEGRIRDTKEKLAYEAIEKLIAQAEEERLLEKEKLQRLTAVERSLTDFGTKYGGKKSGVKHAEVLVEIREQIAVVKAAEAEFAAVVVEDGRLSNGTEYDRRLKLLAAYLAGENRPQEYRQKVEKRVVDCEAEHDQAQMITLKGELSRPVEYDQACIERLQEASKSLESFHNKKKAIADSQSEINSLLSYADRFAYEKASQAVAAVHKNPQNEYFLKALSAIDTYLNSTAIEGTAFERPTAMASMIDPARTWFKSIVDGREFDVTLISMYVPQGHRLYDNVFGATGGYSLSASGAWSYGAKQKEAMTSSASATKDSAGVSVDLTALEKSSPTGKMKFKLGESKLYITAWRKGTLGWYDCSAGTFGTDQFFPVLLAEGITISDANGKDMILKIRVEDATIPTLPQFEAGGK